MSIDGVYSWVASASAGSAAGVFHIAKGVLIGNDIAGAEYRGSARQHADGSVELQITMETPHGLFHIWSGTRGETFQTREISLRLPRGTFEDGKPYTDQKYGMTVVLQRVPDSDAPLAGPNGRRIMIDMLENADRKWAAHRSKT